MPLRPLLDPALGSRDGRIHSPMPSLRILRKLLPLLTADRQHPIFLI